MDRLGEEEVAAVVFLSLGDLIFLEWLFLWGGCFM